MTLIPKSLNVVMPKKFGIILMLSSLITIFLLIRVFMLSAKKRKKKKKEDIVKENLQDDLQECEVCFLPFNEEFQEEKKMILKKRKLSFKWKNHALLLKRT